MTLPLDFPADRVKLDFVAVGVGDQPSYATNPSPITCVHQVCEPVCRTRFCPQSTTTTTFSLTTSYYYRLWRQIGQPYKGPTPITLSQAYDAMLGSPEFPSATLGALRTAYATYWCPNIDSTDNTAYGVYVFDYARRPRLPVAAPPMIVPSPNLNALPLADSGAIPESDVGIIVSQETGAILGIHYGPW